MTNSLIELPEISEIKELINLARTDVAADMKENEELAEDGKLILKLIDIIEEKVQKSSDFSKLNDTQKIDMASHLNFLHTLLEGFYGYLDDEDFEDEEFEEGDLDFAEGFEEEE